MVVSEGSAKMTDFKQKKYTVCGYDMRILHQHQLDIASEIDRICRKNHIKYSLYGGSVIGAVRHNGFIPWDHDIDIAMPRRDYEKFIKICKKDLSDNYFFSCYKTEDLYPNNWGKMRNTTTVFLEQELAELPIHNGVFVDVHPIDNIIPAFLGIQVKMAGFWSCVHHVKIGYDKRKNWKTRVYKLFSVLPLSTINWLRDITMRMFQPFQTKYVYKIAHPNLGVYPIPRNTFEDLIEHSFEDKVFFIPRNYDEFLTKRYGNYMDYPPESEIAECCTSIIDCKL